MDIRDEIFVIIVSSLPISELRGASPLGVAQGLSIEKTYLLAVMGNLLPVLPLLFFFKYLFHKLENIKFVGSLLRKWRATVEKKSSLIENLGFWGLVLFVAIPSPFTGAWTATLAANLLGFKLRKAWLAIFLGILIAGIIVSLAVTGVIKLWFTFTCR